MINFRYHLVSLIAVFLALGVGIVMGSTVIDQTIVEGLRGTIDRVEQRADDDRKEARLSKEERDDAREALAQAIPPLLEHRLDQVPVVVVTGPDSESGPVNETVGMIRAAGGVVPAIIKIESNWDPASEGMEARLAKALGGSAPKGNDLRTLGVQAFAERLRRLPAQSGGTPGSDTPPSTSDLLDQLRSAGLISVRTDGGGGGFDLSDYPAATARFLFIDGVAPNNQKPVVKESDGTPSAASATPESIILAVARALAGLDANLIVASTSREISRGQEAPPAMAVRSIREGELKAAVSTVDTIELLESRAAVVLALEDLASRAIGHYGVAKGAQRRVPR